MRRALSFAAAAALTAGLLTAVPGSAQRLKPDPSLDRSQALADAPAQDRFKPAAAIPAATARVVADQLGSTVPQPAGGTFSGIRWEEAGGQFSAGEIAGVLQYNAACQWLRAWRDGRATSTSAQVLTEVPSWPTWRGTETGDVWAQVAGDVSAGGGPMAAGVLADCDASHQREVAYAKARRLTPSR